MLKKLTQKAMKDSVKHNRAIKKFDGCRAMIPYGKYQNREGVISGAFINRFGFPMGLIQPYSKRGSKILKSHRDTWIVHPLTEEMLITKPKKRFFERWF